VRHIFRGDVEPTTRHASVVRGFVGNESAAAFPHRWIQKEHQSGPGKTGKAGSKSSHLVVHFTS
jgi:hypothetical protein